MSGDLTAPNFITGGNVTATGTLSGASVVATTGDFSGTLQLPNTSSASVGVLTLGGNRFLHNFAPGGIDSNTFVGANAGNFTMGGPGVSGRFNSAFGAAALFANTLGHKNSAFGFEALTANTTGLGNSAFGTSALANNTTGGSNSAFGQFALLNNTAGLNNSAFGREALRDNTEGDGNSAFGVAVLGFNTMGGSNSAFGLFALLGNVTGNSNSAFGREALRNNTASNNTAVGAFALDANTSGTDNTAVGTNALTANNTGVSNIAVGANAGANLDSGSNNIYIGNLGVSSESGIIRIGMGGTHTATFLAGISGVTVANSATVLIDTTTGQLGTVSSSRRFKQDIHEMGEASRPVLRLRPVTFRYRKPAADGSKPLQYGLIAEEVAEVMPELVVYDAEGLPQTVKYHVLPALLLNELQRQEAKLQRQEQELAVLREKIGEVEALRVELAGLKADLRAALRASGEGGNPERTEASD